MGQFGIGQPVRRIEDQRFITGTGRYTDDIAVPRAAHALVLRSPHAHARIVAMDLEAAKAVPGVLAILTGADIAAYGHIASPIDLPTLNGRPMAKPTRPLLAGETVRFVGDPVAFIVAETVEAARDAAEALAVDYDELPAVADPVRAVEPGAPAIWPAAPDNVCLDWGQGDLAKTEAAFARAARRISLRLVNNRVVSNAMEPRAAIGSIEDGRYVLHASTQSSHVIRDSLAMILKTDPKRIRVITPDVGGGFGTKIFPYPEQALCLIAAEKIGRPVKWTGERSDAFLGDAHGRDNVTEAALALDADGRILALKVDTIGNLGAYLSPYGPFVITMAGTGMLPGLYAIEAAYVRVRGVFTNTQPVDAYRGAGRPEAAYVIERLIDHAAREIGMDPAELRRRNYIRPEQMPYTTALGMIYDSGDFERNLDDALRHADRAGFEARRKRSLAHGRYRGLGIATYIEACAGGYPEATAIRVDGEGVAHVTIGTQNNGQGHETAFAQIVSDQLGIDPSAIRFIQGDTDLVPTGHGTMGSRSVPVGGVSAHNAAIGVVDKGKRLAAHYLEAAVGDIEFEAGLFTIAGTDRRMTLAEIARRADDAASLPDGEQPGLSAVGKHQPPNFTFPNGCHVCELEVDPETGIVEILDYTVVDDFGTVVNPLMLAGQVHGGIAQGVGQALCERTVYDDASGQMLSGSFMDYAMPRADLLPPIRFHVNVVPCRTNPLGIKGAGEAGAIGAPPAVINALSDALAPLGVTRMDMPATPDRIWAAIAEARVRMAAE